MFSGTAVETTMFSRWTCSDIDTDVLMRYNGSILLTGGVAIETINLFRLFESKYWNEGCLVVMSCLCPPTGWKRELQRLHFRYAGWEFTDGPRTRSWYDTLCYEAVVAQMARATVCSIARSEDLMWPCKTPASVCPMAPVPGYTPKACNHPIDHPLQPLYGGDSLTMRASVDGPISVGQFIKTDGRIDLLDLCREALAMDIAVLFLAEWGGALCRACMDALCYEAIAYQTLAVTQHSTSAPKRVLGGPGEKEDGYTYLDFYDHAEGYSLEKLLKSCADRVTGDQEKLWAITDQLTVGEKACINTAVMWHYAVPRSVRWEKTNMFTAVCGIQ